MQKGKRTQQDWSQHKWRREVFTNPEGKEITIDHLQKGNSNAHYILFINDTRGLTVRGDYGNWVFCRNFIPSADTESISGGYWMEKLTIGSTQKFEFLDFECIEQDFKDRFEGWMFENDYNTSQLEEIEEWKNEMLEALEGKDRIDYLYKAYRTPNPIGWSCEDFPHDHKKIPVRLNILFDGFEEICRQMKVKKKAKVNLSIQPAKEHTKILEVGDAVLHFHEQDEDGVILYSKRFVKKILRKDFAVLDNGLRVKATPDRNKGYKIAGPNDSRYVRLHDSEAQLFMEEVSKANRAINWWRSKRHEDVSVEDILKMKASVE